MTDYRFIKNTDACFEIVLNEEEINNLHKFKDHLYLYPYPLPISRVKRIYFDNKEQLETTIWNINDGTAFVPAMLCDVYNGEKYEIDLNEPETIPDNKSETIKRIEKYDKVLGGLAILKVGGEKYYNYTPEYFSLIGYFNKVIKESLKKQDLYVTSKLIGAITGEQSWSKLTQLIYSNIDNQIVENYALSENIRLEKNVLSYNLDVIDSNSLTYILAVLASYGEGKPKSIDDFIFDLIADRFPISKSDYIAFIYGINRGYASFRNKYAANGVEKIIKYHLESQLDYYIIESIISLYF